MKICNIKIENFRGIKKANILLNGNVVFVGDNNSGKSTIFEALDLVMGPDRLSRRTAIQEHDFYAGEYILNKESVSINIEVVLIDLSEEQERYFSNNLEWWDKSENGLLEGPPVKETDRDDVVPALRVTFKGWYDSEEDDFDGQTYYTVSLERGDVEEKFTKKDKRKCGFLYLRTLRTGNRALSLEHGSLLDIILQLKELKPQMWENIISQLKDVSVASEPDLQIGDILVSVQKSLSELVPFESANNPQLKVSNFTREHLRKIINVFMSSGVKDTNGNEYIIPYSYQGTGTVNALVLTLLSMIADEKTNVIFAMEEPEIAIPPHIQKRIVTTVLEKSTQSLFTSHSPYVIEEFNAESIMIVDRADGNLTASAAGMPPAVKLKAYKEELKKRFCETLLARRVLITEGRTEYDVYKTVSGKLQKLHPGKCISFDLLGIAVIDAGSDSKIATLAKYYKKMNKVVYAIYDHQENQNQREDIEENTDYHYEIEEHGIEKAIIKGVSEDVLRGYAQLIIDEGDWPEHLSRFKPKPEMAEKELSEAIFEYFKWGKGNGSLAGLIDYCEETELPEFLTNIVYNISETVKKENQTAVNEVKLEISDDSCEEK